MLIDLITASRSYRSFDPSIAPQLDELKAFINCARLSPSSINLQVLKFRPVTDRAERDAVFATTRWAGKIKDQKIPPEGHEPTAYILICADRGVIESAERFQRDVGICAQSIMLAACEAGYGGCMIGSFSADRISECLHLPNGIIPQLLLALGKPDETVCLAPPNPDGTVSYYRKNGIHYVQKRNLEEIIIQ